MSGIAGISQPGHELLVSEMLGRISHRGGTKQIITTYLQSATLGAVTHPVQVEFPRKPRKNPNVCDSLGSEHLALVEATPTGLLLERDALGVAPLYYCFTDEGDLCFASEIKALMIVSRKFHVLPPGYRLSGSRLKCYARLKKKTPLSLTPAEIASELRRKLEDAVRRRIGNGEVGSWLSGGLDSSGLAALARPLVSKLHTFAAGLRGAPDLEFARLCADYIDAKHHQVIVGPKAMLAVLPEVIYHLESFDALLVRSSIMNYLVAKLASDYVPAVFSGEGGDELFAGYAYLKTLPTEKLAVELLDITSRLHNTALQRVDRCSAAHGTVAHVVFLDPEVVSLALEIPVEHKLHKGVEKWILRRALEGLLPEPVLNRPKAKFWEGAGVSEILADYAEKHISNKDFTQVRKISDKTILNSKEELMYYRIFREHFGEFEDLSWMGRTKGVPTS